MSTAMWRTLVETMGMENSWIADELGVGQREVRRWASANPRGPVPGFARDWILDWWQLFQDRVADEINVALELEELEGPISYASLARYKSAESLARAGETMPHAMHDALVGLVAFGLDQADIQPQIVWREEEP